MGKVREGGGGGWEGDARSQAELQSCSLRLSPDSPDQRRQVCGQEEPAPKKEEEKHCCTNTNKPTNRQTTGRGKSGGAGGMPCVQTVESVQFGYGWECVWEAYIGVTLEKTT